MTREEIYNEVIQDYSHLQYKYEGDELQDKINEIIDDKLHEEARELMEKLIDKYNLDKYTSERKRNNPFPMSLDEFLYEYVSIFNKREIDEINNLINNF